MLTVSELFIYPIKSLGGTSVPVAVVTDRGFQYDRRWLLVDEDDRFLTQRELPRMALLKVAVTAAGLVVRHKQNEAQLTIPLEPSNTPQRTVTIWNDRCSAQSVSTLADEWFSEMLSKKCSLVYMPDQSHRMVDTRYALNKEITSFSDAYPFLIIGQSSLDDLNSRLSQPLPMERFRPNIVFENGEPYQEDRMKVFEIGSVRFYGVKLCERCTIPTVDQDSATASKEPLKTLALYRTMNKKICFGQNLLHEGDGKIKVGYSITIID